jgi:hypothetical protein
MLINGRSMSIKLANEIIDTADIGNTIKKRKKHIKWLKLKLLHILDINSTKESFSLKAHKLNII